MTEDELLSILENLSLSEREHIIEQLVKSEDDIVELLVSIVRNNDGRQSWLAASALSHIEDDRVIPALISALSKSNLSDATQVMLIEMLGDKGDMQVLCPLIKMLNSKNLVVQMATIQALIKLPDNRSILALMTLLEQTESSSLRYTIIEALGDLGISQAIELIQRFRNDEDHHVRRRVERALEKLTQQETR